MDPKDLLPRQWGFKKENQVARYRTLLSVSVKKKAEAQHQDHAGQEGRETVYQGGGFGQKPHQDGSHHKSDIARARDKGHPLGGVHPFEVAPDPEHFWDHHGKTQSVQRKARKGHIGDAGKNQYIARQGDQRSKGHQTDGTDLGGNAVPQKASQGHGGGKGQEARADQIFGGQGHLLQIEAAPIDDGPLATHGHKTDNPQKQKGLEQLKTEPFPLHGRGHNMDVMPVEIKIQGQHQKHGDPHMEQGTVHDRNQKTAQSHQNAPEGEKPMGRGHKLLPILLFDLGDQGVHGNVQQPVTGAEQKQTAHQQFIARGHQGKQGRHRIEQHPDPGRPPHPQAVDDLGGHGKNRKDPQGKTEQGYPQVGLIQAQFLLDRWNIDRPGPKPNIQAAEDQGRGQVSWIGKNESEGFHKVIGYNGGSFQKRSTPLQL